MTTVILSLLSRKFQAFSKKKKSDEAENKSEALPSNPTFNNLILKRGVILYDTPLYKWCAGTFQDGLGEPVKPRTIYISLLDENANVLKTWKAINAWPVKISTLDLSFAEQEIAVESLEFAFSSLESE